MFLHSMPMREQREHRQGWYCVCGAHTLSTHRHTHRETALKTLQSMLPRPSKLQTFKKTT